MVAPIPAMAAAAAVTSALRLGTQVINPAFRPLGALAQELAAVDEICDAVTALAADHGISYVTVFDGQSDGFDDVVRRLARH